MLKFKDQDWCLVVNKLVINQADVLDCANICYNNRMIINMIDDVLVRQRLKRTQLFPLQENATL